MRFHWSTGCMLCHDMKFHHPVATLRSTSTTDSVSQPTSQGISDSGNLPGPTSGLIDAAFDHFSSLCVREDLQSCHHVFEFETGWIFGDLVYGFAVQPEYVRPHINSGSIHKEKKP